ncbi:hypothetical protein ABZT51_47525, partial [Streptomyces sp. NPDC005373]
MTVQPQPTLPEHPDFLWRNPEPRSSYDVVIVGAGGHGLARSGREDVQFLERAHRDLARERLRAGRVPLA